MEVVMIESITGLICGFIGFGIHTMVSISQAQKRLKAKGPVKFGIREYWREYHWALLSTMAILVLTRLVGIYNVESMAEAFLPPALVDLVHQDENHRVMWALWGLAIPTVSKRYLNFSDD